MHLIAGAGKGLKPVRLQVNAAIVPSSTESIFISPSAGYPGSTQTGPATNIFRSRVTRYN